MRTSNGSRLIRALLTALALAPACGPIAPAQQLAPPQDCDLACLKRAADAYWDALLAHDPARLPGASALTFSENGVRLRPGEALWRTISAAGPHEMTFMDVLRGTVVTSALVTEGGHRALLLARLTVTHGAIAQIETIVARREMTSFLAPQGWDRAHALVLKPLAPSARRSRAELVRIAQAYFDRLPDPDRPLPPLDPRCNRVENGVQTTNNPEPFPGMHPAPLSAAISRMGCAEQFALRRLNFVSRVRERRYVLADESRGLILALATFDHDGTASKRPGSSNPSLSTALPSPYSYVVAELFKIVDGKILHIDALITQVPYGMRSPWQ